MPIIDRIIATLAQMYEQHYELAIAMIVVMGAATALLIKCCFFRSPAKEIQVLNALVDEDISDDEEYVTAIPRVPITLGGTVIPAVWASGSAYSYISESYAKNLLPSTQILPTNERARAMGGNPFTFIGAVKCIIKIGSFEVPHTFFVTPDHFTAKALLGNDFMVELGTRCGEIGLSLHKGKLTLNEEVISLCAKDGGRYQSKVSGELEFPSLYTVR